MAHASPWEDMPPGLAQGVESAQRDPEGRCHSLAHLSAGPALDRASHGQRAAAAVGVEGITQAPDGQHLEGTLQDLHARLQGKAPLLRSGPASGPDPIGAVVASAHVATAWDRTGHL